MTLSCVMCIIENVQLLFVKCILDNSCLLLARGGFSATCKIGAGRLLLDEFLRVCSAQLGSYQAVAGPVWTWTAKNMVIRASYLASVVKNVTTEEPSAEQNLARPDLWSVVQTVYLKAACLADHCGLVLVAFQCKIALLLAVGPSHGI